LSDEDSVIVIVSKVTTSELTEIAADFGATILQESGRGVYAAINQGVSFLHEKGIPIFSFLGDDDVLMPGSGKNLLKAFADPNTLVSYGQIWYVDKDLNVLMKNPGYPRLHNFILWIPNLIPNPGTLISVEAWHRIGGYDTAYRWAGDLDFWIKVKKIGKIKSLDVPMSFFRWHDESLTAGQRGLSISEASLVRTSHTSKYLLWPRKIWEFVLTNVGEYLRKLRMGS
jgi:GT2 family glycosyltransferase